MDQLSKKDLHKLIKKYKKLKRKEKRAKAKYAVNLINKMSGDVVCQKLYFASLKHYVFSQLIRSTIDHFLHAFTVPRSPIFLRVQTTTILNAIVGTLKSIGNTIDREMDDHVFYVILQK